MSNYNKIIVLGTAQDGGYPQTGCRNACCFKAWNTNSLKRLVSSLAIISENKYWLIDITPDFREQLKLLDSHIDDEATLSGIFITHAHIGHYIGLLDLGLEVMNMKSIPIYVMPQMKSFLEHNAPFSQLIKYNNIELIPIQDNRSKSLNQYFKINSFNVPHRNEFSETVGYKIQSKNKSLIYLPDIDSWEEWDEDVNLIIQNNDFVILDGTFYSSEELLFRNLADIPHPYIKSSLKKFSVLDEVDRRKVYFTHLNHTNPVINTSSKERLEIIDFSCNIAEDGMVFKL